MDIAASLWPVAVELQLGDWMYEIPEHPAAVWIDAIADPDGGAIVPGLLEPEDQRMVWRDWMRGRVPLEDFTDGWREAIGAVTGRPWWVAARLVLSAVHVDNWPIIHGKLMQRGVDLEHVSIGGFCNIVHVMALTACRNEQERSQYEFELTLPPPEVTPEEAHHATDAPSNFLAAMQQFQQLSGAPPARPESGPAER